MSCYAGQMALSTLSSKTATSLCCGRQFAAPAAVDADPRIAGALESNSTRVFGSQHDYRLDGGSTAKAPVFSTWWLKALDWKTRGERTQQQHREAAQQQWWLSPPRSHPLVHRLPAAATAVALPIFRLRLLHVRVRGRLIRYLAAECGDSINAASKTALGSSSYGGQASSLARAPR